MFHGVRLIPDNPGIPFMRWRRLGLGFSAFLIIASLVLLFTRGLNLGIDFKGGVLIEARMQQAADIGALRTELDALHLGQITLQQAGAPTDVMIRLPQQEGGDAGNQQAIQTIKASLGDQVESYRRVEMVGPQVGQDLFKTSVQAIVLSIGGILLYIWFRFDRGYALATIGALLHDVIVTLGFFSLTHLDFDLSTVAAILLISGYSLNDTVVVFDRLRENRRKMKKTSLLEVSNLSLNETLYRTMMTSGTTFLVLLSLFIFGGEVIRSFTAALIFGIVIGTYSSIYVAAPLLLVIAPWLKSEDLRGRDMAPITA